MSNPISGIFSPADSRMTSAQLLRACQHQAWLKACDHPVAKALWFIESLYLSDLTLEDIAAIAGVPRHHLVRAFALATGHSVMCYVLGRRLELLEPLRMDESRFIELEPPRFVDGDELLVAGVCRRYSAETAPAGIPAQWRRFAALLHRVPGRVGDVTYGVRCNADDHGNLDYVCAVQVADLHKLPAEFYRLRIAPQRYAVFTHRANVAEVRRSFHTIWNRWLPQSGCETVDAPDFERYDASFDPGSGEGGLEIWVPVRGR
jgi:AraC family transcriptional regulator